MSADFKFTAPDGTVITTADLLENPTWTDAIIEAGGYVPATGQNQGSTEHGTDKVVEDPTASEPPTDSTVQLSNRPHGVHGNNDDMVDSATADTDHVSMTKTSSNSAREMASRMQSKMRVRIKIKRIFGLKLQVMALRVTPRPTRRKPKVLRIQKQYKLSPLCRAL